MKAHRSLLFLFLSLGLSTVACAQTSLLVTSDVDCTWKLDGKPQGQLKADDAIVSKVAPGKHLVQAASTHGPATFRAVVEVSQGQELVEIKLKAVQSKQPASTGRTQRSAAQSNTWTDPATGLMWTRYDNGHNVTWQAARDYCSELLLDGYHDWRLASSNELLRIYDANADSPHLKGGIRGTLFTWSADAAPAYEGDSAMILDSSIGYATAMKRGTAFGTRAICVRSPGR